MIVSSWHHRLAGSKGAAEALLAGVSPRGLDAARFDAVFPDPGLITISTTPEGELYYMPAVISRCISTRRSVDEMDDVGMGAANLARSVVAQFRRRPYHLDLPISAWPRFMDAAAGDKMALAEPGFAAEVAECGRGYLMEGTRLWLMVSAPDRAYGSMWRDTLHLVSLMTAAERDAMVAFFDYLLATDDWREESREPNVASAKALLLGRGLMDVLLVHTDAECMEIVDALRALESRHPEEFPPHEVAPVKNLLLDIVAGKRSPDTTLGW